MVQKNWLGKSASGNQTVIEKENLKFNYPECTIKLLGSVRNIKGMEETRRE